MVRPAESSARTLNAHLPAVVVNLDRPSIERLVDKPRNHHPIMPYLARTDDVEEPPDAEN